MLDVTVSKGMLKELVNDLIDRHKRLVDENKALKLQLDKSEALPKTENSLEADSVRQVKLRIEELIKEVDNCIGLLEG